MKWSLSFALIFAFSFCSAATSADEIDHDFSIGLLTELSGTFAVNGADCRKGYELATILSSNLTDSNKSSLPRIVYGDTQGDPKAAMAEMRKMLATDHATTIVVNRSQVGMAMAPLADRAGVPVIGVVGHSDFIQNSKFTFRAWPNAKQEGEALAKYAFARSHIQVVTITLEDEYLTSLTENFSTAFKELGGKIIHSVSILSNDSDFASHVTSIKNRNADAIFVNLGIPQLGPFLKQLQQQQIEKSIYSNYWIQKPEVLTDAAGAAENVTFVEADLNVPKFLKAFHLHFNEPANLMMSFTCFTAATAAIQTASRTGAESFDKLNQLTFIRTPDGDLPVSDRQVEFPLTVKRIIEGKVAILPK